jgi:small subunit ribosomal protein S16
MVRIRLRRVGAKKQPSYRVVAADKESPRDGRFIENLGFYNPRTEPATIQLQEDRIYVWLGNGAQMSDAAKKVLQIAGLLDRYERYKSGESLEVLLEEAMAAEAERNIDPKTKRQAPEKSSKKPKKKLDSEPGPEAEIEAVTETEEVEEEPQEIEEPAPAEEIEQPEVVEEPLEDVDDEVEEVPEETPTEAEKVQDVTEAEESSDAEPEEELEDKEEPEIEEDQQDTDQTEDSEE